MNLSRRQLLRTNLCVVLLAGGITQAFSQAADSPPVQPYPSRTIRVLVGGQPGSISDITARLIGDKLEEVLGNPVVIEDLPGAGGVLAAERVAKSPADGYTLLVAGHSNLVLAQAVGRQLRYDPQRDLAPIGRIVKVPFMLAVNSNVPIHSVAELIAYAKARPGILTYATNGPGTMSQLSVELFTAATGTNMLAVPYKGVASAVVDVVAGRVDVMLTDYVLLAPHVKSGALRFLGVAGARRLAAAPEVPTIAEQGVAGYAVSGWYGLMAPAGTPTDILAKLTSVLSQIQSGPDMRRRLEQLGCEPADDTPAQFRALMAMELEAYSEIARRAGIKVD